MPNWCSTTMTVMGPKKELCKFRDFAQTNETPYGKKEENVLSTDKFIPYPERFLKLDLKPQTKKTKDSDGRFKTVEDKDGYNSGGYDWCSKNWGTKWGICHAQLQVDVNEKRSKFDDNEKAEGKPQLVYTFDTAWSPGTPILVKMSKMFPKLSFKVFTEEESRAFVFEEEFKVGKEVSFQDFDPDDFYQEQDAERKADN